MTEQPESPDLSGRTPIAPAGGPAPHPYGYPPAPPGAPGYQGAYPGAYPPPPMPYGEGYGGMPPVMRNGLGVAALVVGLIGIFPGVFFCGAGLLMGIVAVVLGVSARRRVARGEASNGGVALAGIIAGGLAIVATLAMIVLWVTIFKDAGFGDLVGCLRDAGGDQAKTEQCTTAFEQRMDDMKSTAPSR